MQNKFEFKDGGICAAKGFKASGTYCGIKKPANDDANTPPATGDTTDPGNTDDPNAADPVTPDDTTPICEDDEQEAYSDF